MCAMILFLRRLDRVTIRDKDAQDKEEEQKEKEMKKLLELRKLESHRVRGAVFQSASSVNAYHSVRVWSQWFARLVVVG